MRVGIMANKRCLAAESAIHGLFSKAGAIRFDGNLAAGCDVRQARTVQDKIERLRLFPLDVAVTGYDRAACGLHNVAHNRIADRRDVVAAAYTVVTAVCTNAGANIKGIALLTVVFAVFSVRGAAMDTGERPVARHDNAQMSVTGQFQLAKIT